MFAVNANAQINQWVHYTSGDWVASVVTGENVIWTGTYYSGLIKTDLANDTTYFYNMVNSPLSTNWIIDIALGPNGEL